MALSKLARLKIECRVIGVYSGNDIHSHFFKRKCIEPVKRNHGNGLQWISHRFEIKGGISWREALLRDLAKPNPLLDMVVVKQLALSRRKPSKRFPPSGEARH